jgi:hypothetical protein
VLIAERNALLARLLGLGAKLLDERTDDDPSTGDAWWSGWLGAPGAVR